MTDDLVDLSRLSPDQIRKLRANCASVLASTPNSPKAEKARQTIAAIEALFEEKTVRSAIKTFLEKFPDGFTDKNQVREEQNYKRETSLECNSRLEKNKFRARLDAGDLTSLLEDVKFLIQKTNFIQGAIEKPKFIDAISDPKNTERFMRALYDCLHGGGDPPERLGRFSDVLGQLETPDRYNLARWTFASYLLFFFDPEQNMFVKPTVIQKAMELAHEPFEYDPRPTAENYRTILGFAERLKSRIAVLKPRDMIDVQSFMWHMAPAGKWSED